MVSDEPIASRDEGTAYDDNHLPDRTRVVRRFRRLFNALNYVRPERSGLDGLGGLISGVEPVQRG